MQSDHERGTALVVGGSGVIGHAIASRLATSGKWRTICVSRSGAAPAGAEGVSVDLLAGEGLANLNGLPSVTHVFYAGFSPQKDRLAEVEPNRRMLEAALDGAERGGALKAVILVTGAKYYGIQWGPIVTPAVETAARSLAPNFYYAQEDLLIERPRAGACCLSSPRAQLPPSDCLGTRPP